MFHHQGAPSPKALTLCTIDPLFMCQEISLKSLVCLINCSLMNYITTKQQQMYFAVLSFSIEYKEETLHFSKFSWPDKRLLVPAERAAKHS